MSTLETVSTAGVAPRRKVRFWNDLVSATVTPAAADPLDTGTFSGTLRRLDLGSLRFAEVAGGASSVRRAPDSTRASFFILGMLLSGEIVCRSDGTEMRLGAGDFWLYSSTSGSEMLLPQPASLLAVCIPREQILRHIARPEALSTVLVRGNSGPGALVSAYLRDFWNRAQHELSDGLAQRFAEIGLQMAASAYAGLPETLPARSCLLTQQYLRIRAYIEEHLRDPDLTPQSIADELSMTRGYMHRLFSGDAESPARYILRRRLEECHRALSDCMQAGRSVTTIAFEHGFNSLPHFCRVFRTRYGITPGELRTFAPKESCLRAQHRATAT